MGAFEPVGKIDQWRRQGINPENVMGLTDTIRAATKTAFSATGDIKANFTVVKIERGVYNPATDSTDNTETTYPIEAIG